MLTPQELINMPGYGNAEKHLRAQGQWRVLMEDLLLPQALRCDTETMMMELDGEPKETQ